VGLSLGSLEIDIVGNDKFSKVADQVDGKMTRLDRSSGATASRFERLFEHAGRSVAKHLLAAISKSDERLKQIHDTFGEVGVAAALAGEALSIMSGRGSNGLRQVVLDARIMGHSIGTWTEVGTLKAIQLWESAKFEIQNIWRDLVSSLDNVGDDIEKKWADLKYALTGDDAAAIKASDKMAQGKVDREKKYNAESIKAADRYNHIREGLQKEIDKALADDPEPVKVPDVSGALEKESKKVERVLRGSIGAQVFDPRQMRFDSASGGGARGGGGGSRSSAEMALLDAAKGGGPGAAAARAAASALFPTGKGGGPAGDPITNMIARDELARKAPGRFGSQGNPAIAREILSDAGGEVRGPFGKAGAAADNDKLRQGIVSLDKAIQKLAAVIEVNKANNAAVLGP
jgi:hypothetical protein